MKKLVAVLFALVFAGCSHTRIATQQAARPLPPQLSCVFPSSADLSTLAQHSDAVVDVVAGASTVNTEPTTLFTVVVNTVVLGDQTLVSHPLFVAESGNVPTFMTPGTRYILFLRGGGTNAGQPVFTTNEGVEGRFVVDSGLVYKYCVNYGGPNLTMAPGPTPTVADFEASVRGA